MKTKKKTFLKYILTDKTLKRERDNREIKIGMQFTYGWNKKKYTATVIDIFRKPPKKYKGMLTIIIQFETEKGIQTKEVTPAQILMRMVKEEL